MNPVRSILHCPLLQSCVGLAIYAPPGTIFVRSAVSPIHAAKKSFPTTRWSLQQ